jgi:hypothetical protein
VSRASRRYKKWERETRNWIWESTRQFALDLCYCRASAINPYSIGVALEPGEILDRQLRACYWTLGEATELFDSFGRARHVPSSWRDSGWCPTLMTSRRLLTRLAADSGRPISKWWISIGGVQVDLARDVVTLDDRTGNWRGAYGGPTVAVISVGAVGAVGAVHGLAALVDHPGLRPLRDETRWASC